MVDGKQAVAKAMEYAKAVYEPTQMTDLLFEEIERSEDGKQWLVTLSFIPQGIPSGSPPPDRVFKTLKILTDTGEMISMKTRKF